MRLILRECVRVRRIPRKFPIFGEQIFAAGFRRPAVTMRAV